MKLIKFGILATVATLIFGAFSAKAIITPPIIGTVTNFSKLNISIVITTNAPSTDNGKVTKYATGSAKFTNKELLNLFANWAGTTWPSGAQLVQGWDSQWDGDVLVVDKSGTNVLFDANVDGDHFFIIDIFSGEGAYTETTSDHDPGSESYTWFNNGYFQLFDDGVYLPFTDIFSNGPCTEKFSINWNSNGDYTKWSDSEKFTADNAGYPGGSDIEFLGNETSSYDYVTIHAELDSSGHGGPSYPVHLF